MSKICNNTISNLSYKNAQWEGRGFGRKYIAEYHCEECKQKRRMIISSRRGKNPSIAPGAFRCGGFIFDDKLGMQN